MPNGFVCRNDFSKVVIWSHLTQHNFIVKRDPPLLKTGEELLDGFAECGLGCDEAQDQVATGREVVEVAGVEEDVVVTEEVDGEGFVGVVNGGVCGVAEDSVPAGLGVEEFADWTCAETGLKVSEIFADAGQQLRAKGMPLGE